MVAPEPSPELDGRRNGGRGIGAAPREAAASLGLTEETVRTVLKRVFAKTGVSRQAELAALVGRIGLRAVSAG
jgi:hypothetical protein